MSEPMEGTKYTGASPRREAEAKEHTPSCGLLFLEHARELQQTAWSLNNRFVLYWMLYKKKKKEKFFFFIFFLHISQEKYLLVN